VTQLAGGDPRYREDRGGADPAVAAALAAFAAGTGSEHAALTALASARLLVPVVALPGGQDRGSEELGGERAGGLGALGGEMAGEMATPAIVGRDGRHALPAFTCLQALQRWQPDARPVPVPAAGVWQSALQESQAVIIDIAGPVSLAVEGARLAALAGGEPVPLLHEDPDVRAAVAAVAAGQPPGIRIRLGPARSGADLTLELAPADPGAAEPVPDGVARAIANGVAARLPGRLPQGIALLLPPPGRTA
jgi:SseB protein N-terminal domain